MGGIWKLSWLMLALGLLLVIAGFVAWTMDHRTPYARTPWLAFPLIPGWSLLIMGWIGLVGCCLAAREARLERPPRE